MFLPRMNVFSFAVSLALGLTVVPVMAADLSLRIPGIPGDSTTPLHTGDIALQSMGFGLTNPNPTASASYSEVTVTKLLDKASPLLSANCARGQSFASMTIFQTRTNDTAVDLMKLTLNNAIITSHSTAASANEGRPTETLTLHASSFTWSYAPLP
jgi:type VI secretion system secreted protein Hcp